MCGIFGIDNADDAANLAYLGLYALQHRGQESSGICAWDGERMHVERGMGHVAEIFPDKVLARLPGRRAMGHTRYSTAGRWSPKNAQPIAVKTTRAARSRSSHNGNLTNYESDARAARGAGVDLPEHERHRGHRAPHRDEHAHGVVEDR
jgi:amidophosphoribosyltransferase